MFLNESFEFENEYGAVAESESSIQADLSGVLSLVLETESTFNNIQTKMFRLEHDAIVSENAALLEEGKNDYFKKVVDALKAAWQAVTSFFKKVYIAIMNKVQSIDSFLKGNQAKLTGIPEEKLKEVTVKIHDYDKAAFGKLKGSATIAPISVTKDSTPETYNMDAYKKVAASTFGADGKGDLTGQIVTKILGESKDTQLSGALVKEALANLADNRKFKNEVGMFQKQIDVDYKKAIAEADKGLGAGEEESKVYKKSVDSLKNCANVNQMLVGCLLRVGNTITSDSLTICRNALSKVEKPKKEEDGKKNESASILDRY